MSAAPFPEIEEHEATGETAALYADLRATLGLPFVNLIWRHFPTIPGALPAIWGLLKPLYGSTRLEQSAADLRRAAAIDGIETLPDAVWDGAGIGAAERAEITRVVDEYNRANSLNFLGLSTASIVLRGEGSGNGTASAGQPAHPSVNAPAMRALPSVGSLQPSVLALVQALDGLGRLGRNNATASLYRHLSYWPPFLSVAYAALLAHDRAGTIQSTQQAIVAKGRAIAREQLLPMLSTAGFTLEAQSRERALASIDDFTSLMIGRMTVAGTALRSLLPT